LTAKAEWQYCNPALTLTLPFTDSHEEAIPLIGSFFAGSLDQWLVITLRLNARLARTMIVGRLTAAIFASWRWAGLESGRSAAATVDPDSGKSVNKFACL